MMRRYVKIGVLLWATFFLSIAYGADKDHRILFWYPGAEGSPEQALPLLETWAHFIARQMSFQHNLKPIYRTEAVTGDWRFLHQSHPAVGILSLEVYRQLASRFPLEIIAQTKSEPAGDGTQRYHLFKNKAAHSFTTIELSEPLTTEFVETVLLQGNPLARQHPPLHYADQILSVLQKMGHGERGAAALLNDFEAAAMRKIPAAWQHNLVLVATSPSLPSPPVVLFKEWAHDFPIAAFKAILLAMEHDAEGKEILHELRIRGFMEPDLPSYHNLYNAP